MTTELIVDLKKPPAERWLLSPQQAKQARRLIDVYFTDLGITDEVAALVQGLAHPVLPQVYWDEIESIARQLAVTPAKALICNAYYDLIKPALGCTAFAVDTELGPLQARNLDWWTENRLLNDFTLVCRFIGAQAGDFITVGWPGFVGAFSGMAPGRFAVTLNAVLSSEPEQVALPVVFLIRAVLEEAKSYEEAVSRLSTTTIPSDCLLLVSGTRPGEMTVIERTPTQHARRSADGGHIFVTNDYLLMDCDTGSPRNELQASSCGRFKRIGDLLSTVPSTLTECLDSLSDPEVKMSITVQQMAFRASDGAYSLRMP